VALRERISGVRGEGRHPVAGVVAAAASVVVWGMSSVLIKQVDGVSGIIISFHRLWIGAVLTTVAYLAAGGRITRRLLRVALPGGLAFGLDIVLFFTAVKETTVANATIIGALQLVLVLALRLG
jgi:drug/metabolite transporter (DMT)-like permease